MGKKHKGLTHEAHQRTLIAENCQPGGRWAMLSPLEVGVLCEQHWLVFKETRRLLKQQMRGLEAEYAVGDTGKGDE